MQDKYLSAREHKMYCTFHVSYWRDEGSIRLNEKAKYPRSRPLTTNACSMTAWNLGEHKCFNIKQSTINSGPIG